MACLHVDYPNTLVARPLAFFRASQNSYVFVSLSASQGRPRHTLQHEEGKKRPLDVDWSEKEARWKKYRESKMDRLRREADSEQAEKKRRRQEEFRRRRQKHRGEL